MKNIYKCSVKGCRASVVKQGDVCESCQKKKDKKKKPQQKERFL